MSACFFAARPLFRKRFPAPAFQTRLLTGLRSPALSTLVLTVAQEDAFARENFIDGLLERINGAFIPCDIKILFTACDKPILSGNEKMSGTEVYCRSVEGAQNIAALALAFGSNANLVTPGSDMKVSPYYLTRFLCDCLDYNSCPCEISGGMFLALYRLGALRSSQRLSPFLHKD